MKIVEVRLNNFLFNSGMLGFYKVLEVCNEEEKLQIKGNTMIITKELIENFENKYIKAMIYTYEKDTKWYAIVNSKYKIKNIESEEDLEKEYTFIKKCVESASYKSGYEIIKSYDNPNDLIKEYKNQNDIESKKNVLLKIIEHLENNKEVYCMKDIIYTKINCFWNNVAFLNRSSNKNDIKDEYKKVFVQPAIDYFESNKSGYNCIECGNTIGKSESFGMSWLNDVGVDINRKKSGFWNFNEDAFLCPICNLIYSCVPLGFTMIGSNGIFINNNESFSVLKNHNTNLRIEEQVGIENFEKSYGKIIYNLINMTHQIGNKKITQYELNNIQVIKRIGEKDNQKYEFNMLSKDKLDILKSTEKYFEKLIGTDSYQDVLNNLINGKKQYWKIDKLISESRNGKNINFVKNILMIQLISMGGEKMEERKKYIEDMIKEGERLKKYFYANGENDNKLKSYVYKLQGALRANKIEEFFKLFTMFYGGLGIPMPNCKAVIVMLEDEKYFKLLGYSYIYGIQKRSEKIEEEKNNEE